MIGRVGELGCRPSAGRRSMAAARSFTASWRRPTGLGSSIGCSARGRPCCAPTRPTGRRGLGDLLQLEIGGARGLDKNALSEVTRELAIMLAAGQDLDRALRFVVDNTRSTRARTILGRVRDKVRSGSSLAAALASEPRSFSKLYIGMVRAGEAGGTLPATLDRLSALLERERSLTASLRVGDDLSGAARCRRDRLDIPAARLRAAAIHPDLRAIGRAAADRHPRADDPGRGGRRRDALAAGGDGGRRRWLVRHLLTLPAYRHPLRPAAAAPAGRRQPDPRDLGGAADAHARQFARKRRAADRRARHRQGGARQPRRGGSGRRGGARRPRAAPACRGRSPPPGYFPARTIHLLQLGEEAAQLAAMSLKAADIHEEQARLMMQRLVALAVPLITIAMGLTVAGIISALLTAMLSLNDLAD